MKTIKSMDVQRVRGGTIFMMVMTGTFISGTALFTLLGVFALFGFQVIKWNGEYITGIGALIASPFMGMLFGVIWGLFSALLTYAGLRLLSLFRPLRVEYVVEETAG